MSDDTERREPEDSETPQDEAPGFLKEKKTDPSWKEKAQREKEKLAAKEREQAGHRSALPPASLMNLVEELSLRAMLALGQVQNPATGEIHFDLESAKYAIDMLGVLEQKTQGNLEPAEKKGLADILHNLRLAFVHFSKNPPDLSAPAGASGAEPDGGVGSGTPEDGGPRIIL